SLVSNTSRRDNATFPSYFFAYFGNVSSGGSSTQKQAVLHKLYRPKL
ncbi:hypothetical protein AVEN_258266-2-1, partial [Araneus ventricosus]